MAEFLAIDTSSKYLTVLAVNGQKQSLRYIENCAMQHSVILMDEVDKALSEAGLTPSDCKFFCAVTGPGSFTGIRIGIATAKGFALGADKPLLSLTSFDMIAYNVNSENFYVAIDALRGYYYVCGFGRDKKITLEPSYLGFEEISSFNAPVYGFEDLPFANYTKLSPKDCLKSAVLANADKLSDEMHALYVRKSQAEEAKNDKA